MVNVIRGTTTGKPVSSQKLAEYFDKLTDIEGTLYLGYPIIGTAQGGYKIDALLVSKQHGVIIFHIVEGTKIDDNFEEIQDESITKLESKFLQYKDLLKKRKLMIEMAVVTYAPAVTNDPDNIDIENYPIVINNEELDNFIDNQHWENEEDYFEKVNSVIQGIIAINKKNPRTTNKTDSRGAKLKRLEDSIANLDQSQNAAVLETVEGVQRIRGLAGSGKTIVLALKAAYLHVNHPDWKIAVTFNTRSLKGQFINLINKFTYEHTNEAPDWEKIKVIHAWGSPKIEGIYYEICKRHNVEYLDFDAAKKLMPYEGQEFDAVCKKALTEIGDKFEQYYDVILVDEAQDFSKYFLRLCYHILKSPKRLVYAYDELQSLSKKVMESPELLFGKDEENKPIVTLKNLPGEPKQDIVLNTCYRNSKPILTSAHALGFGIYRTQGLIQMFEYAGLWEDIGYEVEDGKLEDGQFVKLSRTSKTSPKFLEDHSPIDDLILFQTFNNQEAQNKWLVEQIKTNIQEDELRYDDIMVIHTDPKTTRRAVGKARELLFKEEINSNLAGITTSQDEFFRDDAIVFTSIYRAKGNEAAMVYVINAQECFLGNELAQKRNILFTAMTRSKAWLRVIGYGVPMKKLEEEFHKIKNNNFSLEFTYPTQEERQKMNLINRDMSQEERNKITQQRQVQEYLDKIIQDAISIDDVPVEKRQSLLEKIQQSLASEEQ